MDFERKFIICKHFNPKIKKPRLPLCDLDDVALGSSAIFSNRAILEEVQQDG
jgi:hypothetical protein